MFVSIQFSASADAVARIYNTSLSAVGSQSPRLSSEIVWSTFYLHALLRYKTKVGEVLTVPHRGLQSRRFDAALAERNLTMVGTGQPHWSHACNACEKIVSETLGSDTADPLESGSEGPRSGDSIHCVYYL